MAAAATVQKPAGKGALIMTIVVLTLLAAGGGGLVGKLIVAKLHGAAAAAPATAEAPKPAPYAGDTQVLELPPIVTNLAEPPEMRVRILAAIVFNKKDVDQPAILSAQMTDDLIAFLKTLTIKQLQGASGLQNLREDLNERASIRSQGKVREVVIENLVVQ